MKRFDKAERLITQMSKWMAICGGSGLIFATLVTCVSILLKLVRRLLDATFGGFYSVQNGLQDGASVPWSFIRPILGEEELVSIAVGLALFSALPWVTLQKGHIRIDLLQNFLGNGINRILDFASDLALALVAYLLVTRQWYLIFRYPRRGQDTMFEIFLSGDWSPFVQRLRDNSESQILGLPLWPAYTIAEICVLAFFLVTLFCCVRSARAMLLGTSDARSDHARSNHAGSNHD